MNKKIIFWMLVMFLVISSVIADPMTEEQINQEIDNLISQGIQKAKEEGKIDQFESYVQSNFGDRYSRFKSQFDAARGAAPAEGGAVDFAKNNYGKISIGVIVIILALVGAFKGKQIVNAVRSPARRMRKEAKEEKKKIVPFIESLDAVEQSKQKLINAESSLISKIGSLDTNEKQVKAFLKPILDVFKGYGYNEKSAETALDKELEEEELKRYRIREDLIDFNFNDKKIQDRVRKLKKYAEEFKRMLPNINSIRKKGGRGTLVLGNLLLARKAVNMALIKTKGKDLEELRKILTNKEPKGLKEMQEAISEEIEEILKHKEKVQRRLIRQRIRELESEEETPRIKAIIYGLNKYLQSIEKLNQQRYIPLKELIDERFLKLLKQEILRIDFIMADEDVAANVGSLNSNLIIQQQLFDEEKNHFQHLKVTKKFEQELVDLFEEQAKTAKSEDTKKDINNLIDSKKFDKAEEKLQELQEEAKKTQDPTTRHLTTVIINDSYEKIIRKMTEEADVKLQTARAKRGGDRKKAFNEVIHDLEKIIKLAQEKNFKILESHLKKSIDELRYELRKGTLKMPSRGTVILPKS